MMTMMMMTTVLGTLLTTHQGLSLDLRRVMMMAGATQAVQVVTAKGSTITTTDIGSIFLALSPPRHPAPRPKEERRKVANLVLRVANLALRVEKVMPMGITTMMMMMTMITVAMVDMATLEDTMVPAMGQDTILEDIMEVVMAMMIGVTLGTTLDTGMVTTTGDMQVLIQLGQVGQHTTLVDGRSLPIFLALLVLLGSQARQRAARQRAARQRRIVTKFVGKMS